VAWTQFCVKANTCVLAETGLNDTDLRTYAFNWTFVWFPSPGCYEIAARVGSQQSVIYLKVAPAAKKRT
jgi:hypothetical protein